MRHLLRRELYGFALSPMAYVLGSSWLLWNGISFYLLCVHFASSPSVLGIADPITAFFGGTNLFFIPLLVLIPLLTMGLMAGEKDSGTMELLTSLPATPLNIIAAKYIAVMLMWCVLWLPTSLYVMLIARHGDIDLGRIASAYLGVMALGAYQLAIGLCMSVLAPTAVVSAILTFMCLGCVFGLGLCEFVFTEGIGFELARHVSMWRHMDAFARGLVPVRSLVFDASVALLCLWVATLVFSRRYAS